MIPSAIKHVAGGAMTLANRQCRFERAIFVLGHMRCGSTALTNVLSNHFEISGMGEAHIRYASRGALGLLVLSQMRRGCWRPGADRLLDKILHSRYDHEPDGRFFIGSAVFVARDPLEAIPSVRTLFEKVGGSQFRTDEQAADYYERRLADLAGLWERFQPAKRLRVDHSDLTGAPESALHAIGRMLRLREPLENRYAGSSATARQGVGDPLAAGRFHAIVPAAQATSVVSRETSLPSSRVATLQHAYSSFMTATTG